MQLPLINTVITTRSGLLSNTSSQLNALRQERHSLLNHIQELQGQASSNARADTLNRIQENIVSVEQQIRRLQENTPQQPSGGNGVRPTDPVDRLSLSREAVLLSQLTIKRS
jgi:hypothetical protein